MRVALLTLLFIAAFLVFAVAEIPLQSALQLAGAREQGLSYVRADGTVWRGVVRGAAIPGQAIGDVSVRVSPAALLTGALRAETEIAGPAIQGGGQLRASAGGAVSLTDLALDIDVGRLTRLHPRIRARGGAAVVRVGEIAFDRGGDCARASGTLTSDLLTRASTDSPWSGPPLSGEVSCREGRLHLALSGADADVAIDASASVDSAGRVRVFARVMTDDPQLRNLLPLMGFENGEEGFTYVRDDAPRAEAAS
ncbi:MAG: type II secretion system protein N [Caulobacterales bacterium]|nr:type II secretion system protein N [Caulobacterales bacterium]